MQSRLPFSTIMRSSERLAINCDGLTPEAISNIIGPALHGCIDLNGIEPTENTPKSIVRWDPIFEWKELPTPIELIFRSVQRLPNPLHRKSKREE
jgi:hypothetical protein